MVAALMASMALSFFSGFFVTSSWPYVLPTKLNWNAIFSPDHNAYFCTIRDPKKENDISQLAYRDVLTGLANRLALEDALPDVLSQTMEADAKGAILFIDLDGF